MIDNLTETTVAFVMPTLHRPTGAAMTCPIPSYAGIAGWRMAEQGQDVCTADRGADVTKKFSIRLGPPPRRWPV